MEKPPLVTDRALGNLPITQPTVNLLEKVGLGKSLFTEVDTNPPNPNLDAGICVFKEGTVARGQERAQANAAAANAGGNVNHVYTRAIRGFAANMSARGAAQMQASNPRIAYCEQDQVVKIVQGKPNKGGGSTGSASETTPWGIARVGGGQTGATGRAFVIDSGVDLDHPDLNVNTAMSRSFTREKNGDDGNGHGTHVAGTIAAIANNNIGVVGVAAGAEVVAVWQRLDNPNTLVWMLAYRDMDHRRQVWADFAADPAWEALRNKYQVPISIEQYWMSTTDYSNTK